MSDQVMLGRKYGAAVSRAILALPATDRPELVQDVFMLALLKLRDDTSEVGATQAELASEAEVASSDVASAMGVLARMGVLRLELHQGREAWFINPHVAWCGSLHERAHVAARVPPPRLKAAVLRDA